MMSITKFALPVALRASHSSYGEPSRQRAPVEATYSVSSTFVATSLFGLARADSERAASAAASAARPRGEPRAGCMAPEGAEKREVQPPLNGERTTGGMNIGGGEGAGGGCASGPCDCESEAADLARGPRAKRSAARGWFKSR